MEPNTESASPTPASTPTPSDQAQAKDHDHRLLRSAGVVGLMTILSRLTGLWRFRAVGAIFGASGVADAFYMGFIFPNITRRLFGEGAMTSAFVPVFSHSLAHNEHEAAYRTASILFWRLIYWLTLGCVAIGACAVGLRYALPHFRAIDINDVLSIKLFIIMLPYMICINAAAVLMAILNAMKHFAIPSFAPVILNALIILACYFGQSVFGALPEQHIWALAIAVLAGGVIQILIQLPPLLAGGFRPSFSMDKTDAGYREIMANFMPVILLVGVFQVNVLVDNLIAKFFIAGDGPITYLNMGTSVYQLPWSIFSLALGTAALPALSELWAKKRTEDFKRTLLSALRMTLFLAVPCTVGIMLLSEDIVRLLYGAGKFLDNDGEPIRRTAAVVMYSSLGLVFFSLNSVLARALYAMKDMKTPTSTSAKSVAINLILNIVFVKFTNMREGGIALASTLSNAWQTWALIQALRLRVDSDDNDADKAFLPVNAALPTGLLLILGASVLSAGLAILGYFKVGILFKAMGFSADVEGFIPTLAACAGGLLPFWFVSNQYFGHALKGHFKEQDPALRLGIPEEHWSDWLRFEFSVYTTFYASAIMGFVVWAVRDSTPPEGRTFILIAQRSLVPVLAGVLVYAVVSSGVLSREYQELKGALFRRRAKKN